jgi:hypothetical protein
MKIFRSVFLAAFLKCQGRNALSGPKDSGPDDPALIEDWKWIDTKKPLAFFYFVRIGPSGNRNQAYLERH